MARKKLSPGFHTVNMKKKGGGYKQRRVQVLKNGQWKFLKGSGSKKSKSGSTSKKKSSSSKSGSKKKSNPSGGRKVSSGGIPKPITKKGINVPVLFTEAGVVIAGVERGGSVGSAGPYDHAKKGEWDTAVGDYLTNVNPLGQQMSGKLIKWGVALRIIRGLVSSRPVQMGIFYF